MLTNDPSGFIAQQSLSVQPHHKKNSHLLANWRFVQTFKDVLDRIDLVFGAGPGVRRDNKIVQKAERRKKVMVVVWSQETLDNEATKLLEEELGSAPVFGCKKKPSLKQSLKLRSEIDSI